LPNRLPLTIQSIKMKKIFWLFFTTTFAFAFSRPAPLSPVGLSASPCASTASLRSSLSASPLSALLSPYYGVKDALFAGDAKAAAQRSGELLAAINGVDIAALSSAEHTAFLSLKDKLAYDARHISEVTDIHHQREHFAALSANMSALAKAVPLSDQPVYEDYCPMKKAYWLSSSATIQNPYFGSAMPSCGKVAATIKH
jgi:hypothetical protein